MNNGELQKFFVFISLIMIVLILFNTVSLKNKINNLERKIDYIERSYTSQTDNLERLTRNGLNDIQSVLEKNESLFLDKYIDVKLSEGVLVVDLSCKLKKYNPDFLLTAEITADGKIYSSLMKSEKDSNLFTANFTIPIVEKIESSVKVDTKDYQVFEKISTKYVDSLLSMGISSSWDEENENVLNVILYEDNPYMPFFKEDIKNAYFIITEDHNYSVSNMGSNEIIELISSKDNDKVKIIKGSLDIYEDNSPDWILAKGDFTEIGKREDNIGYEVHLVIETLVGEFYTTEENSLASFRISDNGSSHSSGDNSLNPILKK